MPFRRFERWRKAHFSLCFQARNADTGNRECTICGFIWGKSPGKGKMDTRTNPNRGIFLPTCHDDFCDPAYAPLDMAADVTGAHSLLSRNIWRKRLAIVGEQAFRRELFLFWCDLKAGESVRSRARAFTSRLNKAIRESACRDGGCQ